MHPSIFREGKCLVNRDACEYFSGDFRSDHLMRLLLGCSEYEEVLFDVMNDIFMSRESVYFL